MHGMEPFDWVMGILLLGFSSALVFRGLRIAWPLPRALGIALALFLTSVAAALLVDTLLQAVITDEFREAGTHKRRALLRVAPWLLGGIIAGSLLSAYLKARKNRDV